MIDDPLKGIEEAMSPTVRDAVWDWLSFDVYPRLYPPVSGDRKSPSAIYLIATRWHDDDPSGRILRGDLRGETWELIHCPAITMTPDGERALWEDVVPLAELQKRREALPASVWQALYQGAPRADDGAVFRGVRMLDVPPSFADGLTAA